jgi:hypothetical protein
LRRSIISASLLVPLTVAASTARALADAPISLGGAGAPSALELWMDRYSGEVVFSIAAIAVVSAVLFFFILRRAGYNPWLAILMLVPPLGLIPMYMLAFRDWPAQGATRPG